MGCDKKIAWRGARVGGTSQEGAVRKRGEGRRRHGGRGKVG